MGDTSVNGVNAENGTEVESVMESLTKLELDLACSSEKLVNFNALLMFLLAQDNVYEAMTIGNENIPDETIEKAFAFDLLCGFLDSEVRELDSFMDTLQAEIVDAGHKIRSCRDLGGQYTVVEEKLRVSEESLKQSRQQILEVMMQSAKLHRHFFASRQGNWKFDETLELSENGLLFSVNGKPNKKMTEQQKHALRMLEKSLARELDLEKLLSESKQREEELRLKLHHTEQLALRMEEAAELVWGRFLEAENKAEVLMGISKELVGRLQLAQFYIKGSTQRENEMKSRFQHWEEQLKAKDAALKMLESISNLEHSSNDAELVKLRGEVKFLEEQLKESKLHLKNSYDSHEASQEQLCEMENLVESLKESLDIAESRAENAEAKFTQLTETNLELTEELNFLKESASKKDKKVGSLEKQLREQEIQLQHAKATSEASQEQQNMLYSAIWDMETLIEDLKSKVSKAESKADRAEEQCVQLSDANSKLNKELNTVRARVEYLETSLAQANTEKLENAKEIGKRTKSLMDMVMQLALERERIQKQLPVSTEYHKAFMEKVPDTRYDAAGVKCDSGVCQLEEQLEVDNDQKNKNSGISAKTIAEHQQRSQKNQVAEASEDVAGQATEINSVSGSTAAEEVSTPEAVAQRRRLSLIYVLAPVLVLLLSWGFYSFNQSLDSMIFYG